MRVVSVVNQKGGVGKTTACMSLAAICAEASRVLVVDVDVQGSASWWAEAAGDSLPFEFASESDPGVLAKLREAASTEFDVVFVDCPGSLDGQEVLATVIKNSDYLVTPTEPAPLSVAPLIRTIRDVIEPSGVPYRVLVNKVDGRAIGMRDDCFAMLDEEGIRRFKASCRMLSAHTWAPSSGAVVTGYPRDRYSIEAASEYRAVALEMLSDWQNARGVSK